MTKSSKKRKLAKKRESMARRTFMFDELTDKDVDFIRGQIRATSDSEAVRRAVRKMADLLRKSKAGAIIIEQQDHGAASQIDLV